MKSKKEIAYVSLIVVFAFLLRLSYLIFLKKHYFFYNDQSDDVLFYQQWAEEIARGNWLGRDVFWGMPLYPYFLAVLKRLTFDSLLIIRMIHLLLGSLNCLLVYLIAKKLFSQKTAFLAALLTATNFILIYYDWLMMPVTILISLSLIIILSLLYLDHTSRKREWFILGILVGLASLGDGKFLFFFLFLFVHLIIRYQKTFFIFLKQIFLPLTLGICLILAAVMARNKIIGHDWIFISAQSGLSFYTGNNSAATGLFENQDFIRPNHAGQNEDQRIIAELTLKQRLRPSEVSSFWWHKSLSFIKESPGIYFHLLKNKVMAFLSENEGAYNIDLLLQKKWKDRLDVNPFSLICPMALLGILFARRKYGGVSFLNLMILSQLIFTLMFFHSHRHRAIILPFFLIFQAHNILWTLEQIRKHQINRIVISMTFIMTFLIILHPQHVDPRLIEFVRASKSGVIYAQEKQYQKAMDEYTKALKLQPMDITTLYNLGNAVVEKGELTNAIKIYERALKIHPFNTDILFNLACVYEKTEALDTALGTFKKVIDLQPESPDAHFHIAEIYRLKGDCLSAVFHYNVVKKSNPFFEPEINRLISTCKTADAPAVSK